MFAADKVTVDEVSRKLTLVIVIVLIEDFKQLSCRQVLVKSLLKI